MSEKRHCPACDSYTSNILRAFEEGDPCPVCGLPAEASAAVETAEAKGADKALVERTIKAEQRAANAEAEAATLRRMLNRVRRALDEDDPTGW